MSNSNFFIITFVDEDDALGIVASKWITPNGNTCYYPNVRTDSMRDKLVQRMADPEDTWSQYKIKILKGYETYGEARLHLKKAEDTSNLDSDNDELTKRIRKTKIRWFSEESNSSDDYPISKLSKSEQTLTKKKKLFSQYPAPPKPTPIAKENEVDIQVLNNVPINVNLADNCPLVSSLVETVPFDFISSTDSNQVQTDKRPLCSNQTVNCPSGCIISKQFAFQQSHLIQVVTDLSTQMTELNRKVDSLLGRSEEPFKAQSEDVFTIPAFLSTLPVKDDASFCNLNDQLKISQNKQAMIKYLAGIGGRNIRSLTTNMLRRILLDDVAELYSLTGKQMKNSTKKSFETTETCAVIFQICKNIYDDVTEEKLKEIISDWLNQAKVRLTRRAEREKRK